jgi:hypothetical protein
MAKKIAKVDADAMNSLYASELGKTGIKSAAAVDDRNGAPDAPQAFEDHAEYIATMKSVMAEDKNTDFSPNDPILD